MGSGTVKTNRWLYPNQSLDLFRDNTSIISAAGVSYVGSRVDFILGFPSGDFLGIPNSYFGPNFQFTTPDVIGPEPVPEPATWVGSILVAAAIAARIFRRFMSEQGALSN